jgi:hypothetical protein
MGLREAAAEGLDVPINGPVGRDYAGALGAALDDEQALVRAAALLRLPARCPVGALGALGALLQLDRYPGEADATYRARLAAAWETWTTAGSAACVEAQIAAALGPGLDVVAFHDDEFAPFPSHWHSRFVVVLGPALGSLVANQWVLGAGTLGSAALAGNLDDAQRRLIKSIALRWKAAHGYAAAILVRLDATPLLGLDWTLGASPLGGTDPIWIWIGRLFGCNFVLGATPLGGYDRS